MSVPALSEKDEDDLRWGLKLGADFIALSFVRSAKDYEDCARIMAEEGRVVPVIAKVEKPQAVDNLEEIVDAFDGVMVARGDLGVELPLEEVPLVQKRAIELCRSQAKPVIVATQVLESMISSPVPTRAETSDCANAVLDGADAVMLSGETSMGEYPIITVETMARIIKNTELKGSDRIAPFLTTPHTRGGAITAAALQVAERINVKAIVTFTQSGDSALRMARLRPKAQMYAFTPEPSTYARLALTWGIYPDLVPEVTSTDEMVDMVDKVLKESGRASDGDYIVVVSRRTGRRARHDQHDACPQGRPDARVARPMIAGRSGATARRAVPCFLSGSRRRFRRWGAVRCQANREGRWSGTTRSYGSLRTAATRSGSRPWRRCRPWGCSTVRRCAVAP